MLVFFIGAFNKIQSDTNDIYSVAGSKVQLTIIDAIDKNCSMFESLLMREVTSWPKKKLFYKKEVFNKNKVLPFINFYLIKHFFFSIQIFIYIIRRKPTLVYFYNCYFSLTLITLLCSFLRVKFKSILIIQDLEVPSSKLFFTKRFFNNFFNFLNVKIIKYSFDFFIPVTNNISNYLNLKSNTIMCWPGGITENINNINESNLSNIEDYAVFAGSLTYYNGIDKLILNWVKQDIKIKLHIFGDGELSDLVSTYSNVSDFIIFHGFSHPDKVNYFIKKAKYNFCLRYSININQNFYFPSKFFDLLLFNGLVICNKFNNIPIDLIQYVRFVSDDLSDLSSILHDNFFENQISPILRKNYLINNYNWNVLVDKVNKKFFYNEL